MQKFNTIFLYFFLSFILASCADSNVGKVLRNEKITNTDEFLVKKKEHLSLPPDYDLIPEPDSVKKNKELKEKDIDKILKIPKDSKTTKKGTSSVEQSIINQIRK